MSDTLEDYIVPHDVIAKLGGGDEKLGRRRMRLMVCDLLDRKPINGPTDKPASVRIATEADEPALLDLLLTDLHENGKHIALISEKRIMQTVRMGTRREGGIVAVIDGPENKPIAACCLIPMQWWWSEARYVQEVFLYTHPDHRKSHHSAALLQFEKWVVDEWTRGFGYPVYLLAGVTSAERFREKVRLYRRHLNEVGGFFVYPSVAIGDLR